VLRIALYYPPRFLFCSGAVSWPPDDTLELRSGLYVVEALGRSRGRKRCWIAVNHIGWARRKDVDWRSEGVEDRIVQVQYGGLLGCSASAEHGDAWVPIIWTQGT